MPVAARSPSARPTVRLAKQFGFCYGVERAIDLAYAARKVFPEQRIFLLGEIIHNPDVNAQIAAMGIRHLAAHPSDAEIDELQPEDVVIVPAFGAEIPTVEAVKARGSQIVDTTCGDVMSVWKRVRQNARRAGHLDHSWQGKARGNPRHRLPRARRRLRHYLVVLDLAETDFVCDYIRHGGDKANFCVDSKARHHRDSIPT